MPSATQVALEAQTTMLPFCPFCRGADDGIGESE